MSNVINFAPKYTFFYTKVGKQVNAEGNTVQSMVDTGISVELRAEPKDIANGSKKLTKTMIERFKALNGGDMPLFRMEVA